VQVAALQSTGSVEVVSAVLQLVSLLRRGEWARSYPSVVDEASDSLVVFQDSPSTLSTEERSDRSHGTCSALPPEELISATSSSALFASLSPGRGWRGVSLGVAPSASYPRSGPGDDVDPTLEVKAVSAHPVSTRSHPRNLMTKATTQTTQTKTIRADILSQKSRVFQNIRISNDVTQLFMTSHTKKKKKERKTKKRKRGEKQKKSFEMKAILVCLIVIVVCVVADDIICDPEPGTPPNAPSGRRAGYSREGRVELQARGVQVGREVTLLVERRERRLPSGEEDAQPHSPGDHRDKSEYYAWESLFRFFNKEKRGISRGYVAGEKVAVKINLNTEYAVYADNNGNSLSPNSSKYLKPIRFKSPTQLKKQLQHN